MDNDDVFSFDGMMDLLRTKYSSTDVLMAISGLLDKGLLEEVLVNGQVKYKLTSSGFAVKNHMTSKPSSRN